MAAGGVFFFFHFGRSLYAAKKKVFPGSQVSSAAHLLPLLPLFFHLPVFIGGGGGSHTQARAAVVHVQSYRLCRSKKKKQNIPASVRPELGQLTRSRSEGLLRKSHRTHRCGSHTLASVCFV